MYVQVVTSGHEADSDIDCNGDCFGLYLDASLSLNEGNNLVSFHAVPDETNVGSVFSESDLLGVIGEGNAAALIDGSWYGSLDGIDATSGYWVQANSDTGVEVCGDPQDDVVYTLHGANNLVSYSYADAQSIGNALPDETEDALYAIVGEGVASINLNGFWAGSLDGFEGGKGYWMARTADADEVQFQYNAPSGGDARYTSFNELPVVPEAYAYTQSTLQGFYFIDAIEVDGQEISNDSWILAYNDGVIVGARQWNGEYTDIPAMGNDGSYSTVGYMEAGDIPEFKIVNANGVERDLYVSGSINPWSNQWC
jgi:hypothetical protein